MRRLRERIASFEGTVFERMTSEISRLRAISSLLEVSVLILYVEGMGRLTMSSTSPGQSAHQSARRMQTSLPSCWNAGRGDAAGNVVLFAAVLLDLCALSRWDVALSSGGCWVVLWMDNRHRALVLSYGKVTVGCGPQRRRCCCVRVREWQILVRQ